MGISTAVHDYINSISHWKKKKRLLHTDDEAQRGLGGGSGTTREQVLDGGAGLDAHGSAILPPDDRAPLWVHESLFENVVKDVLEVEEARGVADVNNLCSDLLMSARCLVVGDPELSRLNLRAGQRAES